MTGPVLPGVGGPGYVRLNAFGALIREAYDHVPYLVGSAVRGKTWRDVDVRLILPDDEFQAMFGVGHGWGLNPLFCLLSAGVSALGKEMTGLPIDFQFQPQTHANEKYPGARQPLGVWSTPIMVSAGPVDVSDGLDDDQQRDPHFRPTGCVPGCDAPHEWAYYGTFANLGGHGWHCQRGHNHIVPLNGWFTADLISEEGLC
jgi:hypothetical protein